jgi:hypothetical protein
MTGVLMSVVFALASLVMPGSDALTDGLVIEGTIGGQDIAAADSDHPVPLDPEELIPVRLTIRNEGTAVQEIQYVRLEGKALGLTFLTYDLGVKARLDPGERTEVETALDFFDLESQATGYLGTSLRVYDAEGHLLGEESFVVDVLGKTTSTLGIFAFVVLGLAAFSVIVLIINTVRRRLPANRFIRAMQFAIAGGAIGITLSLGVSILRIGFADVEQWVPLVFLPTIIAFMLGYIAPGPLQRSIRDVQDEEKLHVAAQVAIARSSGINTAATSAQIAKLRSGRQSMPTVQGK